jgi:hypothetical protein
MGASANITCFTDAGATKIWVVNLLGAETMRRLAEHGGLSRKQQVISDDVVRKAIRSPAT